METSDPTQKQCYFSQCVEKLSIYKEEANAMLNTPYILISFRVWLTSSFFKKKVKATLFKHV